MTREEKAAYMKVYNTLPEVKAAKKVWASSLAGRTSAKAADKKFHAKHESKVLASVFSKVRNITPEGRFSNYKASAKRRGYSFELTLEDHFNSDTPNTFWQKPCTYCGEAIKTIGLDRIDN